MQWVELGVGILQGDQRAKQGKWLDQATWSGPPDPWEKQGKWQYVVQ